MLLCRLCDVDFTNEGKGEIYWRNCWLKLLWMSRVGYFQFYGSKQSENRCQSLKARANQQQIGKKLQIIGKFSNF